MSNYANFNFDLNNNNLNYNPTTKSITNPITKSITKPTTNSTTKSITNPITKSKFITNDTPCENKPGYWLSTVTKADVIDNETLLITPAISSKDKIQMKLNDNFTPNDYNINYSNSLRKDNIEHTGFYYNTRDVGPGRGFGNLNISNDIRNGNASREDTHNFKEQREGQQLFDYQFQYLDRNFQDPNHLVMPIPRGGDMTRKQNQLTVNTMRDTNNKHDPLLSTIKFNY